jgi:hypothetical protein
VVRITSDTDPAEDEWESGFSIPVNSDGTFSLTQSMYLNSYKDGHTFQVVVFKNHIDVDELNWECGEYLYTYLGGDLSYGAWKNIVVSPQDYQA